MNRDELINRLKRLEPALRDKGVAALFLYGSYARVQASAGSDIDIIVEFAQGRAADIAASLAPYELLEESFPGASIGYGERENIPPAYRRSIEQSTIRVF